MYSIRYSSPILIKLEFSRDIFDNSYIQHSMKIRPVGAELFHVNTHIGAHITKLTPILRRSRTGTVWFYTSTSNKRAARPKLYTKSLTRDLKHMYSRFTLVRISINLQAPCVLYIGTGVSLLSRERFYIFNQQIYFII